MDHISDEPGRIASEYLQRYGGEAILSIDGDIADASAEQRWDDYTTLHRARLRLRRLQLFEQITHRMSSGTEAQPQAMALNL